MARTFSQLNQILGEYVQPGGKSFAAAMQQVLPRLHDLGLWRDLVYEISIDASLGYVALPVDIDAVLVCTVNDLPRPLRSLWSDIRISGRLAVLSGWYGVVDAGYFPVMRDLTDVTTYDAETGLDTLQGFLAGSNTAATTLTGEIVIETDTFNSTGTSQTLTQTITSSLTFAGEDSFSQIKAIRYNNVNVSVDLVIPTATGEIVATVPEGSGVLRFRRFRVPTNIGTTTTVHFLVKRAAPTELTDDTVIYLSSIGALKAGLLAVIAEDNSDLDRAARHWGEAGKILDQELQSITGGNKPRLKFDLSGGVCLPVHSQY
jgi:hypothetical protein